MCLFQSCLRHKKSPCADHKRQHRTIHLYIELARTPAEELENLHPLGLYLLQEIGARNIGEIETVSHAIQFVQFDQHYVGIATALKA